VRACSRASAITGNKDITKKKRQQQNTKCSADWHVTLSLT